MEPMTTEYFYFVFTCGTKLRGHGWLHLLARPLCHQVFEFKAFLNNMIYFVYILDGFMVIDSTKTTLLL
jgi:hypothetical protein